MTLFDYFTIPAFSRMNIHQKINAKGNNLIFYPPVENRQMSKLIKQNYKQPLQDINLPDRLYLKKDYNAWLDNIDRRRHESWETKY